MVVVFGKLLHLASLVKQMHSKHKNILPAIFLSLLIQLLLLSMVRSQSLGEYRSKQNGIWQDILVWEIYDSGSWTAAVYPPNQHSGNIEIIHQINITQIRYLIKLTLCLPVR
ncbi:MAG: hypothetical protein IPG39_20760 [Bacteroidetes bacterium]|nr:hypothetical protein [Bacteroidota bacterium]